jgi:hypothetical protein
VNNDLMKRSLFVTGLWGVGGLGSGILAAWMGIPMPVYLVVLLAVSAVMVYADQKGFQEVTEKAATTEVALLAAQEELARIRKKEHRRRRALDEQPR